MGWDEFGPAYPDPEDYRPARPLRSRILDLAVMVVLVAGLLWLLGCSPSHGADSIQWVPRLFVHTKDGTVQPWRNKVYTFDTEGECKAFLIERADETDGLVRRAYGDALDHFDASCYMVIPERNI